MAPKILSRPPSTTDLRLNWLGILCMFAAIYGFYALPQKMSLPLTTACVLGALLVPILLIETVRLRRLPPHHPLAFPARPLNCTRILVKLTGLWATFGLLALAYWVFPEYQGSFYRPLWEIMQDIWPYLLALSIPYMVWVDCHMKEPGKSRRMATGIWDCWRWGVGRTSTGITSRNICANGPLRDSSCHSC